jgi:hypothetical protein
MGGGNNQKNDRQNQRQQNRLALEVGLSAGCHLKKENSFLQISV